LVLGFIPYNARIGVEIQTQDVIDPSYLED